jgi:hypothetical protein
MILNNAHHKCSAMEMIYGFLKIEFLIMKIEFFEKFIKNIEIWFSRSF